MRAEAVMMIGHEKKAGNAPTRREAAPILDRVAACLAGEGGGQFQSGPRSLPDKERKRWDGLRPPE